MRNVAVSVIVPSAFDDEFMYSMPSTPLISCSSGAATVSAIVFGLAPGYCARTTTVGGTTSGYSEIGSKNAEITPSTKMTIESTPAKIGRSTKKRANFTASPRPPFRAVRLHASRLLEWPLWHPGAPFADRVPRCVHRYSALLARCADRY